MMLFNKIFTLNQDTFNNSEYLSWYNSDKRRLEEEFNRLETKQLETNFINSITFCDNILTTSYAKVTLIILD
jgi:hypothetical protein